MQVLEGTYLRVEDHDGRAAYERLSGEKVSLRYSNLKLSSLVPFQRGISFCSEATLDLADEHVAWWKDVSTDAHGIFVKLPGTIIMQKAGLHLRDFIFCVMYEHKTHMYMFFSDS